MERTEKKILLSHLRGGTGGIAVCPTSEVGQSASKKAAFTVEYVIVIAVIVAALLAMQFYLRRAVCGRIRSAGDAFGQGRQYEPGVTAVTGN